LGWEWTERYSFDVSFAMLLFSRTTHIVVVLENNNKHLKQRLAEGLPLFRALLSSRQEVGLGEPEAAAVPSVRLSAW
jgi:hypothetical protein